MCNSQISCLDGLGHDTFPHYGRRVRYALDSRKATRELCWKPLKDFEQGLKETFDHYRSLK